MVEEGVGTPLGMGGQLLCGPSLEQRTVQALEEIQSVAGAIGPKAATWRDALRDVHAHIYGERRSVDDPLNSTGLIDAYRRLYDELLQLSTMLDPDISRREPEVPE